MKMKIRKSRNTQKNDGACIPFRAERTHFHPKQQKQRDKANPGNNMMIFCETVQSLQILKKLQALCAWVQRNEKTHQTVSWCGQLPQGHYRSSPSSSLYRTWSFCPDIPRKIENRTEVMEASKNKALHMIRINLDVCLETQQAEKKSLRLKSSPCRLTYWITVDHIMPHSLNWHLHRNDAAHFHIAFP